MREQLGGDTPLRLLLETIVADGGRGAQAVFGVARLEQVSSVPQSGPTRRHSNQPEVPAALTGHFPSLNRLC